jgi:hypothetical protein
VALDTLLAVTLTGSYVWAHDLDGDGDLDLSVVDEEIDSLYVFPNGGTAATGVASQEAAEPAPDALVLSIHPAPASAEAGVTFQLRGAAHGGSLELFDVRGRLVRRLELAPGAGGAREIPWNVRDANGGRLPPGVYLARLTSAGRSALRSLRLLP